MAYIFARSFVDRARLDILRIGSILLTPGKLTAIGIGIWSLIRALGRERRKRDTLGGRRLEG
jgi:hypothetical protein